MVGRPEEQLRPINLDAWGGFLGAGYRFADEIQTATSVQRREHILEERAGLGFEGSVYSPNFLTYEAVGIFGLIQDWAEDAFSTTYDDGQIYEFDGALRFFPRRWHPANFTFSRINDVQPQVFLSQFENLTTSIRGEQLLSLTDGNIRVEAEHRETEQRQFGVEQVPFLDVQESTAGISGDYRLSGAQTVSGRYQFQDVHQSDDRYSFSAHAAEGVHTLVLGERGDQRLRSRVEGYLQDGYLDQDLLRWEERFDSRIAEDLDGDADFRYEYNNTNLIGFEDVRGGAGITHRLFESLVSSIHARGGGLTTFEQGITDTAGGDLSLNYRKNTGIGVYRLSYANSLERRWIQNAQGGAIDESHRFPVVPPFEIRLSQQNIDPASIAITDITGLIFYREGLDYTVSRDAAGFVTITRALASAIVPGQTLLIDYLYQIGGDYTLDTMIQHVRTEHEFWFGLAPYFAWHEQDQRVDAKGGSSGLIPVDERSLIGGVEWRGAAYLLGAEYETRESTLLPFDAARLRAECSLRIEDGHLLTANATQGWFWYDDPSREVAISQALVRWRTYVGSNSNVFVDSGVQYHDDSLQGTSFGYSVGAGLEYHWRRFAIRFRISHREIDGESSEFRGTEAGIWIVRDFGSPPPGLTYGIDRFLRQ